MKLFEKLDSAFATLRFRDRVIAVSALAACLVLGGNLIFLKPQLIEINRLKARTVEHQKGTAGLASALAEIENYTKKGIDPLQAERAILQKYQQQIKDTEAYVGGEGASASVSQVGILVRNLIHADPGLTLVSLRTLPSAVFYSPPQPKQQGAVTKEVDKYLAGLKKDKTDPGQPYVLVNKILYKHGVEVSVKGGYSALLSYMEEAQKLQQRIFWSDVSLDARKHKEATLKMVMYILSDQASPSLN